MWVIPATIISVFFIVLMYKTRKDMVTLGKADLMLSRATEYLHETIQNNEKSKDDLIKAMSILEEAKKNLESSQDERKELDLERSRLIEIATRIGGKSSRH